MDLKSKVALVTGSAQGIGKAISRKLLKDGYRVVLCDLDEKNGVRAREQLSAFGDVEFFKLDVSSEADVKDVFSSVRTQWKRLDVLVNNAGIADPNNDSLDEFELSKWNRMLSVNLTGPFLCAKHASSLLRESKGSILNIASTRALMSEPHTEAYSAAKGGLVSLTHALAMTLAHEVRVNCISPGWIDVSSEHFDRSEVAEVSQTDHDFHPAGRVGRPDDIANLVSFLASPEAGFITGANFVVDGGVTRKMIYES